MMSTPDTASAARTDIRPALTIRAADAYRLSALAEREFDAAPILVGQLLDELERAEIVPDDALPGDVIGMGSEVAFRDETGDRERTVRLVYPADANIDGGRVSILTPVGAALLGLRTGDSIEWPMHDGLMHRLHIVAVRR